MKPTLMGGCCAATGQAASAERAVAASHEQAAARVVILGISDLPEMLLTAKIIVVIFHADRKSIVKCHFGVDDYAMSAHDDLKFTEV
ncbi:hypothetical protein [Xanthobacter tagetidis]|jgi:hypothetical protein|uniref:hypothetical protein n=1 Tax=Xanthobacter tagetidis TaxID=60216 RepID=UPI00147296AD|nr:hypothetical protein [Xanthobacter tagetidis]MBB6306021.1 hypothetical protein [Xanthobacter tagetidis]